VVLFGPTPYKKYMPHGQGALTALVSHTPCSPCHGTKAIRKCADNVCMKQYTVHHIIAAVRDMLRSKNAEKKIISINQSPG
jgi:hypothetical protein